MSLPFSRKCCKFSTMKPSELVAKELEERALQRKGVMELWGRSWKGDLLINLKTEHETAASALSRALAALPVDFSALDEDGKAAIEAAASLTALTLKLRGLMLDLALHPTRPKAQQSSRGGGRPRNADPVEEAQIVEGSAPDPAP